MTKWKVDFSGVEDGYADITPGKYVVKVEKITKEEGTEYPYLKWELVIVSGKAKGLHINHITSLKPSALFNLRNTLTAIGLDVPKAAVNIEPNKLIGKTFGVETTTREYNGKNYPNVKKVFSSSDMPESASPTASFEDISGEEDDILEL